MYLCRRMIYQVGKGMIIGQNNMISIDGGMRIRQSMMREILETGMESYGFSSLNWKLPRT